MYAKSTKNAWSWFLIILVGIVIGGFIGHYLRDIPYLNWLAYGQKFGTDEPVILTLGIIKLQFGLLLDINIASVVGVALAVLVYKRM